MEDAVVGHNDHLVGRAKAGDTEAFSEIVARYGPDVLRLSMVITGDPPTAEDAAQNTWSRAWRRIDTLRDATRLRPWLLRIAANEAKQVMRRNRRHPTSSLDLSAEIGDGATTADADLRATLAGLDLADRELLAYRYVLGLTSDEIGRHLGLSGEGVRSRLKRLRDRLAKEITDDVR